ncbi:MAG: PAS domain-containing protein, partial [Caulobacterales bacterium]
MGARDRESAAGPQDRSADLALAKPPTQRFARIATLAALLMLALYTGVAIARLMRGPQGPVEQIASLVLPLAVASALGVLLLLESRRVERAHAAYSESEQRFRLAVEAARCGIWEWDLAQDEIFMSDVTAALFGWRGGVVDGQQVLERVS